MRVSCIVGAQARLLIITDQNQCLSISGPDELERDEYSYKRYCNAGTALDLGYTRRLSSMILHIRRAVQTLSSNLASLRYLEKAVKIIFNLSARMIAIIPVALVAKYVSKILTYPTMSSDI